MLETHIFFVKKISIISSNEANLIRHGYKVFIIYYIGRFICPFVCPCLIATRRDLAFLAKEYMMYIDIH